jgi:membrane fusion protein (multidrug efflux system)
MPRPTATITTIEATTARWQAAVRSVGSLGSIMGAELATEVPGMIEQIYFDNGAEVSRGEIILTLNSAPDRAELAALEAASELAAMELRRASTLVTQRNISASELDQRSSQVDQAQARVAAQQARIEQKALRAPYDGRLGIRRYNVGDYVQAGDPIIELQSLDRLYVNFSLPEQYSGDVRQGMTVTAGLPALQGDEFTGVITAIAPVVDTDTRNFDIQATIENRDDVLRPGMVANVTLPIGLEIDHVIVPRTAIAYRPYGNSVYVVGPQGDGLGVTQRFVTLGPVRGDMIAVLEGLNSGETVATSGLLKLDTGVPVVIDNSVQPSASLEPRPDNG